MSKKVTFVYPNPKWQNWSTITNWDLHPYNICLLASMIKNDREVDILDANIDKLTLEQFSNSLREKKPDICGISIITNEYAKSGLIAAKIAKEINPDMIVVIGGVSAISNPLPLISDPNVDYLVYGEGEYVFKELCNFLDGKTDFPNKGVIYKKDGEIIKSERVDFIQDLDALPLPSYDLVDFNKYINAPQRDSVDRARELPYARIKTARGCPFNCCFCEIGSISGKKVRFRSVENVIKELEWLIRDYGIKSVIFDDDNFIVNKEYSMKLFQEMIDKNLNLKWNAAGIAVNKLDSDLLDVMKRSGCQYINIALESGSQRVLRNIVDKPVDLKLAQDTIKLINSYGIDLAVNFVIGFPGETWEEILQTIDFAGKLDAYVKFYGATPLPNTRLYDIAKEGGYLRDDFNPNKHLWTQGWIKTSEFTPKDIEILRAYMWEVLNFTDSEKRKNIARMMGVTEERLSEIRKETLDRVCKKDVINS